MTVTAHESGIKTVPISDVYLGLYDGPHATPKPADDGPVFLGIKNLTDDGRIDLSEIRHISEEEFPKWTKRVTPQPGDIVFTYEATLHRYAIIPEGFRGCLGRRMALIRPDTSKVDTRYLYYYFFSDEWRQTVAQKILHGSTVDRIPLTEFPEFRVSLPPLETQRQIADILSAYDDLIENNTRRIQILEEMARTIYREWFVHFRYPGHESIPLVDSPIGPVPEGWELGRLKDLFLLQRGFDLPTKQRRKGNIPVYAATGIVGFHDDVKVEGPGVVTGRSGSLGTVSYIGGDFWPLNTTLWVREFRRSHPLHAYYHLSEMDLQSYNSGAAVPTLNRNYVHEAETLLPPTDILTMFGEHVQPIHHFVSTLKQSNVLLADTRILLLPCLISGKIVLDAE